MKLNIKILNILLIFNLFICLSWGNSYLNFSDIEINLSEKLNNVSIFYGHKLSNPDFIFNSELIGVKEGFDSRLKKKTKNNNLIILAQFHNKLSKEEVQILKKEGIKVLNRIGKSSYYISISRNSLSYFDSESKNKIDNLNYNPKLNDLLYSNKIYGVSQIDKNIKLSKSLKNIKIDESEVSILVKYFEGTNVKELIKKLKKLKIKKVNNIGELDSLEIQTTLDKIELISDFEEVMYVQKVLNFGDELVHSKNTIKIPLIYSSPYDLNGSGILVFQYEGGVPSKNHSDLIGKISYTVNDSYVSDHATHIAGIILGNGVINSNYSGVAIGSNIWSDTSNNFDYNQTGDLVNDYILATSIKGVNLASNSFGVPIYELLISSNDSSLCHYYGEYEAVAEFLDKVVSGYDFNFKNIPIVFSAGNERDSWNNGVNICNQVLNYSNDNQYYTINPPKAAKNIISVGSVKSDNSTSDLSSYGPTQDGRIKPELVAPGEQIVSTIPFLYSDFSSISCNSTGVVDLVPNSLTDDYCYPYDTMSGTSMAAPHVSGTIALMLEQWNRQYTNDPLPSTIKAMLLDSSTDLSKEGDGVQIIDGPDYKNGYGLLNAKEAVDRIINETFVEDNLTQGQTKFYSINISNQSELKVTLAWDDLPGNPALSSEGVLVNDLDLKLISPSGKAYYPWTLNPLNPSDKAIRTKEDHINNVEQIYINSTEIENGSWVVVVSTYNIDFNSEGQKFSLVSSLQFKDLSNTVNNNLLTDIAAYYQFDKDFNVESDLVGNLGHTNAYMYSLGPGLKNKAYFLRHSRSYIEISRNQILNLNNTYTISFWFKSNLRKKNGYVIDTNVKNRFLCNTAYNKLYCGVAGSSVNTTLEENRWHFITLVKDVDSFKLYLDGYLKDIDNHLALSNLRKLYFGKYWRNLYQGNSGAGFDEIGIWNRTLSSSEIAYLYNGGSGVTYPFN